MHTKLNTVFIFCILCFYVCEPWFMAQTPNASQGESTFEYTKRMYKEVEELKNIMPDIFPREVDRFRDQMERYIFHKKRVWNGLFSSFALAPNEAIIDTVDAGPHMQRKLNPEEKKLCFKELKAFQVTYINNLFTTRRRYLEYLHELRTRELDQAREEALNSIKRSFAWP